MDKLTKDKVMRPSLIDSVDKINEIVDTVNGVVNPFTFTPYAGFTTLSAFSKKIGSIVLYSVEIRANTAQSIGEVKVGKFNTTIHGLGSGRVSNGSLIAGASAQVAPSGEVRFFHQVQNATTFWGFVITMQ